MKISINYQHESTENWKKNLIINSNVQEEIKTAVDQYLGDNNNKNPVNPIRAEAIFRGKCVLKDVDFIIRNHKNKLIGLPTRIL